MSREKSDESLSPTNDEESNELLNTASSNERVLCTAFFSFMSFAIAQFAFSIIAKSQAMLGDSLAMIVDALTYLFNWFAERKKEKYAEHLKGDNTEKAELLYRKYTYQLEIFPPFLTVSTLVVLNSIILKGAIHVLVLDTQRDATLQDKPNVDLMLLFSALNFLLDGLNIFCFAREKHGLGYKSTGHDETMQSLMTHDVTTERESIEENDQNKISETSERMQSLEIDCTVPEDEEKRGSSRVICCKQHSDENSNLNMCSAYTHVAADTMRSIAVIAAALLAEYVPSITAEEADATAAVVVSILIFLSLIPLVTGMIRTYNALRQVEELLASEESCDKKHMEGEWRMKYTGSPMVDLFCD